MLDIENFDRLIHVVLMYHGAVLIQFPEYSSKYITLVFLCKKFRRLFQEGLPEASTSTEGNPKTNKMNGKRRMKKSQIEASSDESSDCEVMITSV